MLLFPTALIYTEDCLWAAVDTACGQTEVPLSKSTAWLRFFPLPSTPFPASPGSTSLINHLYANPHPKICLCGTQPKTLPENDFAMVVAVAGVCLCLRTLCDELQLPRLPLCTSLPHIRHSHTVLRFLPGKSAAHPVSLGLSPEEMSPSLCLESRVGIPRSPRTLLSTPPWR